MSLATTDRIFTPNTLDSYERFINFFDSSKAIQEIRKEAESAQLSTTALPQGNVLNRWQVVQLKMTAPFSKVYTLFSQCIRDLLFSLGLTAWALQASAHNKLWEKDRRLESWERYGENCLTFSINAHSPTSQDVYLQPSKAVSSIGDYEVKNIVHPRLDKLVFYKPLGCCRGMSEWFLHLYFQTKHYFADDAAHIKAVGKQFENGASSQASLLQTLYTENRSFLGLQSGPSRVITREDSHDATCQRVIALFKDLEPGAYAVGFHTHRMNYISLSADRGYLFDPNHGVIAIEGHEGMRTLADLATRFIVEKERVLLDVTKITPI